MSDQLDRKDEQGKQPADVERFADRVIRRRIRSDAFQHPATILPLAAAAISGTYLVVLAPVTGGGSPATVVLGVSAFAAAAGFTWRYAIRFGREYALAIRDLMDEEDRQRELAARAELEQRLKLVRDGFAANSSAAGTKAAADLASEYELLRPAMAARAASDPITLSNVAPLAEETYRRGLSVLSDVLGLIEATRTPGSAAIKSEIADLEQQLAEADEDRAGPERVRVWEDTLASQRRRLELIDRLGLHADRLLYQAHRCEASLHRTRIELAAIRAGVSESSVNSVIDALQGTIQQAKEVQEELARLGY